MSTLAPLAATRDAAWKAVDEAIQKGLPRTAITNLDLIIPAALQDKAYGEATKAIARKIVLEGNVQGNKAEEKITRMEAEIAKAPRELKPLLQTVLATWYWHYFQNNRWRFLRRTATAATPGRDFTTWDLPRLFAEIDKHFAIALQSADLLQKTPITAFDDLLDKGSLPDRYRPTLFDFIGNEALRFYTSGEHAAAQAQDAFEISADGPMLSDVAAFLAWNPDSTDTNSIKLKAIRLSQQLLRFHEKDTDITAFLDADLGRLQFGHNLAFGETKDARYKAALQTLADRYVDHELSALALHLWARVVQREGDLVEARRLAQRGENAHRDSAGGRLCHNLIQEIEAPSAQVSSERVWNAPWPNITVRYRNLTNVWFRAVPWTWTDFLDKRRNRPEYLNDQERAELLAKPAALEWSETLPPTTNYQERARTMTAPNSLKPGFYFLIASYKPDFSPDDNQVQFTDFWVSELAVVVRTREGRIEGFVLEALSGEPLSGAAIDSWFLDQNGMRIAGPANQSDENGFFSLGSATQRGHLLRVRHNGREVAAQQDYWGWKREPTPAHDQTIFFTDRSLYRPGQTIQYKGIAVRVDTERDNYEVLAGRKITVVFADPNGKEVAKMEHACNDYGSFNGSFIAPRDRVMGQYRIYVSSGQHGQTNFRVEEYKRPKFQVKLDAPKTAARLKDKVVVRGHADSYTGAAVDDALVKWRVVREVRWPVWWGWYDSWRVRNVSASQEIANGTMRTATDGSFDIEFVARPDPQVSETNEASFQFSVYADVTDGTGETRSSDRSINVGFTALSALLSADPWQTDEKPVPLKIHTSTLDGEPQTAEGRVRIYRLKEPPTVYRPHLGEISNYQPGPTPERPDLSDPTWWELGDVVQETGFTTDAEGKATLSATLGVGMYRAMLETQDRFGKKVTSRLPIQVIQPSTTKFAIKIPHLVAGPKWSTQPGEEFMAVWGTGYDTGRAYIEIEHRGRFLQKFWTKADQTQQQIRQGVDEAMRGGFTLHVTQVRENRAYTSARHVDVPWSNKELEVKWEHFTSKLDPAKKETWSAVITGSKAEKAGAEFVAALYDASLDQFNPHGWLNRFSFFRYDHSSANYDFLNGAKALQHLSGQWRRDYTSTSFTYRQFPGDLVANFWGYEFSGRRDLMRMRGANVSFDGAAVPASAPALAELSTVAATGKPMEMADAAGQKLKVLADAGVAAVGPKSPDLTQVTARRNLNETAFFFPQLRSDSNGAVRLEFTMPEALTEWRFLGFAHDRAMRSGSIEGKTITAKDLMVQPNPPRFLREGDILEFTVKISNQSATRQEGKVRLTFTDAATERTFDQGLGNDTPDQAFDIPAKES
ncbi:MAG TPA: alpha-2-macroglobulin family protein, partial [Verrucomicrobiae bacterium]|nr:alpha-2-macroglobulin family protein [Verrucomicrobiae bacterium]